MITSIGIDAAWTVRQSSGVCLLKSIEGTECEIVRLGRSYDEFSQGSINWSQKVSGLTASLSDVLNACADVNARPDCIAVDMPIASYHIKSRRDCETAISKAYGRKGASTHNPNEERPGMISVKLYDFMIENGYNWMTNGMKHFSNSLIEVYPHTAIIEYLDLDYRYEYKVSKKNKYKSWSHLSATQKQDNLIRNLNYLVFSLSKRVPNIYDFFEELSLDIKHKQSQLKGYEDALDSVICALTGIDFIVGNVVGFGNEKGTIWVPKQLRIPKR